MTTPEDFDNVVGDVYEHGPFHEDKTLEMLEDFFVVPMPVEHISEEDLEDLKDYFPDQQALLKGKLEFQNDLWGRYDDFKDWKKEVEAALTELDKSFDEQLKLAAQQIKELL